MIHNALFKYMMYFMSLVVGPLIGLTIADFLLRSTSEQTVSGVSPEIMIDNQTGCHYLYRGALTPRMDRDGKQICEVK